MVILKDHYKVLGIQRSASDDEIKKAYRNLAKQFHPDKNKAKEAEEKFKEISAAYDVLKDADKKKVYDMQLLGDEERANRPRPPYASQSFSSRPGNFETSWGFTNGNGDDGDFFTSSSFTFMSSPRGNENERDSTRRRKANNRRSYGPEHSTWNFGWNDENIDADTQAFFRAFGNQGGNQFPFMFGNFNGNMFSDFDDVFKGFFEHDLHMGMGSMFNDPFFEMYSTRNAFSFENIFSDVPSHGNRGTRHTQSRPKAPRSTWDDWPRSAFKERSNDFMFRSDKEAKAKDASGPAFEETLLPCSYCGRKFNISSLGRHEITCEKQSSKNTSRPEYGTESPRNAERRRKREEFVRNLCNMRTSREETSADPFTQFKSETRPSSTESQVFGSSAKTNPRHSADRRGHQPRSARTPGTRSRLSESDSSDDDAGTGGIFYKAQTARSSSSRPHTSSRRRSEANSRKTENSNAFPSCSYIPSRLSQKDKGSNLDGGKTIPTFSARPKGDVRS